MGQPTLHLTEILIGRLGEIMDMITHARLVSIETPLGPREVVRYEDDDGVGLLEVEVEKADPRIVERLRKQDRVPVDRSWLQSWRFGQ